MQQFTAVLLALAPYLLPPLLAVVGLEMKKLWDRLPANQRGLITTIVGTAVAAVQQTMPGASPAEKRARALEMIEAQLTHIGIHIPMAVLDPILEEAVLSLKGFMQVTAPAKP